jgi:hypothetical protein
VTVICCSCGCSEPVNSHNDERSITLADISAAADAAGITLDQAVQNIVATVVGLCDPAPAPAVELLDVAKAGDEPQRFCLGVAYQPGRDPRIAKGVDGGRDFFTEAELEKAAWSFLRNGPQVNTLHMPGTEGCATVVESSIHRGPDWDLGDGIVVTKGTWLVGAILDPPVWQAALDGRFNGWSPEGTARRRRVRPAG